MKYTPLLYLVLLGLSACVNSGGSDLSVALVSPSTTAYTNGTLSIQATVSATPDSLELLRDGKTLATLTPPYTFAWDTSAVPEGGYSLGIRASKSGKTFQGEARSVFVDRTPPTLSLTTSTVTLTEAGSLELAADASDNRGIAKVEFFNGDQKVGEDSTSPYNLSLNFGPDDNREHNFSAKVADRAGNSTTSSALKVNVLIPKRVSENLIINGDAEAGSASSTGNDYVSELPGWPNPPAGYKRFTIVAYGTVGGFPAKTDAPANGGNNFFAGGPSSSFNGSIQTITLPSDWFAAIDAGTVKFDLSGYFGGFGSQGDSGGFSATFLDTNNFFVTGVGFKAVSATERGGKTGFVRRASSEVLPKLTRKVQISLEMNRSADGGSYNDGYADNLSLVLKAY